MTARTNKTRDHLQQIGAAAYESILEMLEALGCDYGRREELREECRDYEAGPTVWATENPEDAEELRGLDEAAAGNESEEDARERIKGDPLEIMVGGWWPAGGYPEAQEYRILLGTGGDASPATRICGAFNSDGEPATARLEAQDQFVPWTEYDEADEDALLAYVHCFNFGDV